ncbi:hypothetical protein BU23DRAFT_603841 [Bimuria novae-zelandiae CBS 107.79]|uniref:Tse2 ADP-ribosyltransferase toxin domain-containing protein n=1 Tax=Bimuria novae-zelandiae CBS 107.79 TaxID=1447943 RepID=A0A6A5ULU7_9PLEO|nr:hypothetical protein BU23DRAFT_603841 [Bimuria novae-zelandiae CBS 107.79]
MSKFIRSFKVFPVELFRVNNGRAIRLREWAPQKTSYDIITEDGRAKAKALNPATYAAPNGASMRPNSEYKRDLIQRFRGQEVVVYSISAGTQLPDDLVLVHEYDDHYSLQAARDMPLQDLNNKITSFLERHGRVMAKETWLQAYKPAASSSGTQPVPGASNSAGGSASTQWVWDDAHKKYRYWDGQKWVFQ